MPDDDPVIRTTWPMKRSSEERLEPVGALMSGV
jgi:hypothetical protein